MGKWIYSEILTRTFMMGYSRNMTDQIKIGSSPLIETKLYIPKPRAGLVERKHLVEQLNEGLHKKLTVISAPAGFGKTTFLTQWVAQADVPVAWVSIDANDSDPARFLRYVIAALQSIAPGAGRHSLPVMLSPDQMPVEVIVTHLIQEMAEISNEMVLALDDFHLIEAGRTHQIFELLTAHLPHNVHLILSARVDPPLPLARLRARNQLNEIRASDLLFTREETSAFFNKLMKLGLSDDDIYRLQSRAEGWVAGLQLAALSLQRQKDVAGFISAFAGDNRHIVDYLTEEVLHLQSETVQDFLLKTSIFSRFSAPLCEFVIRGNNSQDMLEELEKANLFIVALDDRRCWYRYHHLFADLLRQKLHQKYPSLVNDLHLRASRWFEESGLLHESVGHAIEAKAFERAASLIEKELRTIWENNEYTQLWRWINILPSSLVDSRPELCILHALDLFYAGRHKEAHEKLKTAESQIQNYEPVTNAAATSQKHLSVPQKILRGKMNTVKAFLASHEGDTSGMLRYSQKALRDLPKDNLIWTAMATAALADANANKGDLKETCRLRVKALKKSEAAGNIVVILMASSRLAISLRDRGRLDKVREICEQKMQFAAQHGWSQTAVAGFLLGVWGEVLAETNDLDGALNKSRKGVELTERGGGLAMLCWTYLSLIRVLFSRGDIAGAQEIVLQMEKRIGNYSVPSLMLNSIEAWQVRIWLAKNQLRTASKWEHQNAEERDETLYSTYCVKNLAIARVMIAEGRLNEAVSVLSRLLMFAERGDYLSYQIQILILQALAYENSGDTSRARDLLGKALKLSEPKGFFRIFVDEGPELGKLLEKVVDVNRGSSHAYARELLPFFRLHKIIKTENEMLEALSDREMEVLKLIAAGLSNKMIMEGLFISMSTVKTHVRNIFSKLNVHSRTEAIFKAKEMELF